MTPLLVVLILR